ncbi:MULTISPECIES: hypothetical protein [Gordonia]|uniref:hypothetical protein n=1 Tax=Gordonia TaxID=2053 RepID=UPI0012E02DB4|nr:MULTISPECIES: hypothetical protein [Gordonia]WFN92526.1 hypothetical protein P5P27_17435 [Gordonia sihwensis]
MDTDAAFAASWRIGSRINAVAQAEILVDSVVGPPQHIRRRLDAVIDDLLDPAD